jgi:hypothetical protein
VFKSTLLAALVAAGVASAATPAQIQVGRGPGWVVAAGGQIWVGNHRDCTLEQIDPKTGQVTRVVNVGRPGGSGGELGFLGGVAATSSAVFGVNGGSKYRTLVRVDANSGKVSSTKVGPVSMPPFALVADGGHLWLGGGPTVWELDSGTLATVDQADLSNLTTEATPLASADGGLWIGTANEQLIRLDEATLKPTATVKLFPQGFMTAAPAGDSLWVAATGRHSLIRVDARTGKKLATMRLTGQYNHDSSFPDVSTGNAHSFWLWLDASHLEERSAITGAVVKTLELPAVKGAVDPADYYQGGVTTAFGSTWVTEWPGALGGFTSPVRGVLIRFGA